MESEPERLRGYQAIDGCLRDTEEAGLNTACRGVAAPDHFSHQNGTDFAVRAVRASTPSGVMRRVCSN
eukprot:scaffold78233_cov32-Tisochrysis_lutea.AAC.2